MKLSTQGVIGAFAGAVVGASLVFLATAQDQKAPMDEKAMMEAMEKLAKPGKSHDAFKELIGTWQGEVTGMDPVTGGEITSKGTGTFSLDLGGRWLRQDWKGEWAGQPFEGIGYMGYDNAKQQSVSMWMDTMSTSAMINHGTYDAATKTWDRKGMSMGPDGKEYEMREVFVLRSPTEANLDMFMKFEGQEVKIMSIKYTKQ